MKLLLLVFLSFGIAGDTLYQIEGAWRTNRGEKITLRSLKGKPTLIALVYLKCDYLCPTVIAEVTSIEARLTGPEKEKMQVVLVSFDPERDTPEAMKRTIEKRKLPTSWKIITSDRESVLRTFTNALDFRFRKETNGDLTHSFLIALLDSEGGVRARLSQANQDKTEMVRSLRALIQ